jgi:hypothetical protein
VLEKGNYIRTKQEDKKVKRASDLKISPENKSRPINAREFLICSPAGVEGNDRSDLIIEGNSAVVDASYKWENVCALSP